MTLVVLVILAVVWAVYLASWIRSRTEHRRVNSIHSFSHHLSVLERTTPAAGRGRSVGGSRATALGMAPRRPTMSATKKRRRDVLVGLLAATGVTFLGTLVMGGAVTYLFGLTLVLTVAYVAALASIQKRAIERRTKVRYLETPAAPAVWSEAEWAEADEADAGYAVRPMYAVNGR